ncbi:hypothetical protein HPB52_005231 [Rhipicephalus sanguineus]|uniref:Uncharacterized protein n=1 Tax=Rhipicephalus sanguineus TaxID=34632 RepID=A0A9D4SQ09_RHISA|nr:hypothetical protein HPB52_005231 [Rhipicephalus sanguineus]
MDTQRAMADLPELQRRLLERSRLLGFEPYADAPMRVRDRPSSEQDSGSGDDGEEACAVEAPVSRPRGKTCASGSPTMTLLNPIGSKIRAEHLLPRDPGSDSKAAVWVRYRAPVFSHVVP